MSFHKLAAVGLMVVVLVLMGGCGPSSEEVDASIAAALAGVPTATPQPSPTPQVIPPTATPQPSPTPQTIPTPLPTATPQPSPTPQVIPTPLPTATPVMFPTPLPTATPVTFPTPLPTATPVGIPPEVMEQARQSVVEVCTSNHCGSATLFAASGTKAFAVTAAHTLSSGSTLEATIWRASDNKVKRLTGKVLKRNTQADLALVEICCDSSLPSRTLRFGDNDDGVAGEWVYLIGHTTNSVPVVTGGVISNKNARVSGEAGEYILHDAEANPGSSGGPLVLLTPDGGIVIGIQLFGIRSTNAQNYALMVGNVRTHLAAMCAGVCNAP